MTTLLHKLILYLAQVAIVVQLIVRADFRDSLVDGVLRGLRVQTDLACQTSRYVIACGFHRHGKVLLPVVDHARG